MWFANLLKKPQIAGWMFSASLIMFVSSNFVNAGNMLFNLLFSRWLGPELFSDLAFLLTLKLSILGVLNAIQFLVTEKIASAEPQEESQYISSYRKLSTGFGIITFLVVPLLAYLSFHFDLSDRFGLQEQWSLLIFYVGIPFYLPLALWRGVAQGRIDLNRIVLSANAEMLVRLIGGALFWWLGLGVPSIIFAFVLSLFAAWHFAKPKEMPNPIEAAPLGEALPWRDALPWAMIQMAVILLLDGDVFVTKLVLNAHDAGLIAAISIVQRIIFFASFSMAAILLPQVIKSVQAGGMGLRAALPIVLSILASSSFVLAILKIFPELSVSVLFGAQFDQISALLFKAGISATLITFNYFIVIFLMAHKASNSAYLFIVLAITQLLFLSLGIESNAESVALIVERKFQFQIFASALLAIFAGFVLAQKYTKRDA